MSYVLTVIIIALLAYIFELKSLIKPGTITGVVPDEYPPIDERNCFTHYELIESLSRNDGGYEYEKILIITSDGRTKLLKCEDMTRSELLIILSQLTAPIESVMMFYLDHPDTVFLQKRRVSDWCYFPTIHLKNTEVL